MTRCYQVMATDDRALLDAWIANWADIADFEVIPVVTSPDAAERIRPRLLAEKPRRQRGRPAAGPGECTASSRNRLNRRVR